MNKEEKRKRQNKANREFYHRNKIQININRKEYHIQYRLKHKEKHKILAHNNYLKNRTRYLNNVKQYYKNNKEKCLAYQKEYIKNNKEKILIRSRIYNSKNRNKLNSRARNYHSLPCNRLRHRLIGRIYDSLRRNYKIMKTMKLTGCDIKYLANYLESQFDDEMSWANMGKWHIDHIKPCASFDLSDTEQQKICFHYSNLQPLWASINISKGAKL